ncbi:non-ribosomal peptide synthase/polyketide synthase [Pseudoalteromonas luteoviolacea]|uniref:non-ribosomal peptide synthase/polyketide synthase n=1 Tax=Pseudoalteromonas luteoviolacea TaxID=43657 RepID=UPI001EEE5A01|nr:non-ribosomal peptide synthase/polyketide synthase [Pseudoalteromonas luteoviolacea]
MSAIKVIKLAQQNGIYLYVENGRLGFKTKPGAKLTDELKKQITDNKKDVISYLSNTAADALIDTINPRSNTAERERLSFSQQQLWLIDKIQGSSIEYNVPIVFNVFGHLNLTVLEQTFCEIASRHHIFRTNYVEVAGEAFQIVKQSNFGISVDVVDFSEMVGNDAKLSLSKLVEEKVKEPFNLANDAMIKCSFIKLDKAFKEDGVLIVNLHHIACDGWSKNLFISELATIYSKLERGDKLALPALPIQYIDYAAWQREKLQGPILEQKLQYWLENLRDASSLNCLTPDFPRLKNSESKGKRHYSVLEADKVQRLAEVSQRNNITTFMLVHAAFALVLSKHMGTSDVVIGTPSANRLNSELENLIGFFVNTLALRVNTDCETLGEYLSHIRSVHLGAQSNQEVPFELIIEKLRFDRFVEHSPLVQILIAFEADVQVGADTQSIALPGLDLVPYTSEDATVMFDLRLDCNIDKGELQFNWIYNSELYEQERIAQLATHLHQVLTGMTQILEHSSLDSIQMIPDEERHHLVNQINNTATHFPITHCIHDQFEQCAKATPDAVALMYEGQTLSYAELNSRANRLARYLRDEHLVGPDTLVGLCLERSFEMVVGILAIFKAGGAYVPLDPNYPDARLEYMVSNANMPLVLSVQEMTARLPKGEYKKVYLDEKKTILAVNDHSSTCLKRTVTGVTANHLAYVIYTSGSTGQPKGVMVEHQALVNRIDWMDKQYICSPQDKVLQKTPFSFDVSVWEFVWPLTRGACLVLAKAEGHKDPAYLCELIRQTGVTKLHFVPSMLHSMLNIGDLENCASLAQIFCSGEVLSPDLITMYRSKGLQAELHNLYGPTEAAIDVTFWDCAQYSNTMTSIPIGAPIQNTQLYVLDEHRHLLPKGVAGELYIGGVGLARGYVEQPELTASRFVNNPFYDPSSFQSSANLYRTGDIVRWLPDGNLAFMGRVDDQVKVRGFRIELGEIEYHLCQCDGVDSALVLALGAGAEQQLVAYVRFTSSQGSVQNVKAQLSELLPSHMVPSVLMPLEEWPVTPNGKIDRKALPSIDGRQLSGEFVPPTTKMQNILVGIWASLLKLEPESISIVASFFELGGHSLLAVRMVSEIRRALNVEVSVKALFEAPTIQALEEVVSTSSDFVRPDIKAAERGKHGDELSFAQQRLWFIDQLQGESPEYNMPFAFLLSGYFDITAASQSLTAIIARHEILRTVYQEVDGQPLQHVLPCVEFSLTYHDLSSISEEEQTAALNTLLIEEAKRPFDLSKDLLLRCSYVALEEEKGVLLFNMHHIASDGWSMALLTNEFTSLYRGHVTGNPVTLKALPLQYADYAKWQRKFLQGELLEAQLNYWRRQLEDVPITHGLRLDHARPQIKGYEGERLEGKLSKEVSQGLEKLASIHQLTPFMLVHSALSLVLARHSNSSDIVIGTPAANRLQSEVESLIGFFVNTLVLRVNTTAKSLSHYLKHVREVHLGAQSHQDVPFEQLVELLNIPRNTSHTPLFQIMLTTASDYGLEHSGEDLALPELSLTALSSNQFISLFDIEVDVQFNTKGVQLNWTWDKRLFEASRIAELNQHLQNILTNLSQITQDASLNELDMLSNQERHYLLHSLNDTAADYASGKCVHELFQRHAELNPDAIAVVYEEESLSYGELNRRSNQLAHYIRNNYSAGPDELIGICVERGLDMIVGVLGIMKAGSAYVPMDPNYPDSRLAYMMSDANMSVVLTTCTVASCLPQGDYSKVILDDVNILTLLEKQSALPPMNTTLTPEHLAYVIYTSGSTGQPKGVMIQHESVVQRYFGWQDAYQLLSQSRRHLQMAGFGFDVFSGDFVRALCSGGALVICPRQTLVEPQKLYELIVEKCINIGEFTPAIFRTLCTYIKSIDAPFPPFSYAIVGSDSWSLAEHQETLNLMQKGTKLVNSYGTTECTIDSSYFLSDKGTDTIEDVSNIGRPFNNVSLFVLDKALNLLPAGVTGELHIGGAGLARGYLNQPELTASRFIENPFYDASLTQSSSRLYRTGDLVRYLPDGNLAFIGRADSQVKVRGFRIEPGEVEHHLTRCEGVGSALVMAVGNTSAQQLVAYVVPSSDTLKNSDWLQKVKKLLSDRIPLHMVPSIWMQVDEWPLTPNGKIDRKALPSVNSRQFVGEYEAPESQIEKALVDIWAALLKVEPESVSTTANFFELGGDSIMSIQVVTRGRQAGYHFSVRDLFDTQTIRALAPRVKQQSKVVTEQGEVKGEIPLLPIQSAFFASNLTEPHHYNQSALLETPINLNASHCHTVMRALYQRHDALRLRFSLSKGQWQSHFKPFDDEMLRQSVVLHDLSALTGAARKEALESACQKYQRSLNFVTGPVFRMVYFHYGDSEAGRLLFVCHHLVVDGVSWRILLRDVELAYSQLCEGKNVELGLKTSSVKAWSEALRDYAGSEALQAERDWWVSHLSPEVASLPRSGESDSQEVGRCSLVLDETQTTTLLQTCQRRFKTRINELLLAGLLIAYQRWGGGTCLRVNLEGHGREALFDTLDIGETVGWFTSVYPLMLSCSSEDIEEVLRTVKQVYRELPQRGIGFGMLKYLTQDSALYELDEASFSEGIVFNYLGQFDNTFDSESEFFGAEEFPGDEQSALNGPEQLLSINGSVSGGRLGFELSYAKSAFSNEQAEAFAQAYKQSLVELVEAGATLSGVGALVPTDFPHASLEAEELRSLETTHSDISRLYITTPMQRGMLYHGLLDGTGELYTTISHFDLEGGLDIEVFRKAWQTVVNRHDILRTSIVALEASVPHQLVQESVSLPFNVLDWQDKATATLPAALEALRASEKARGFDFAVAPLMRLTLVCLPEKRYHFIWAHHHILLDGWCQPVLFNEVVQAYQALSTGVELVANAAAPYEDFIAWLASQDEKAALNYWAEHLAGFDSAVSLTDYQNNTPEREGYGEMHLSLSQEESDKLVGLARQSQSTINVLLQFAWSYLLHRYTGESDIVFGATISGRPAHINGIEEMVGLFINTIPVRIQLDSGLTLGEVLGRIHHDNIEREHHGYLSLAEIQGVSDIAPGSSLFETLLVFENYPTEVISSSGSHLQGLDSDASDEVYVHASDTREYTNYPLSIGASFNGILNIKLVYQKAQYSHDMMTRIQSHLASILVQLSQLSCEQPINALEMLSQKERHYLLNTLNDTAADYQSDICIHELFEQRALANPTDMALKYEGKSLSYADLDKRANQLAHYLRDTHSIGPDSLVGLCIERSFEMVIGILATLKAGGAWVPLDPGYPDSRLEYMVKDAQLNVILSTHAVVARLPQGHYQSVLLDDDKIQKILWQQKDTVLQIGETGLTPEHLAYVIYTSGSTGKPKGVMVSHRALVNRIDWMDKQYGCTTEDRILQKTPFSFDVSVWEFIWPLSRGAELVLAKAGGHKDPVYLSKLIRDTGVTKLHFVPSMLHSMLTLGDMQKCPSLAQVFCSGEALPPELVTLFQNKGIKAELHNLYGPTEAAIDVTYWDCAGYDENMTSIPIGHPIQNTQLYVLDAQLQLLPAGAPGELYIGGEGLARGYLNKPELSATRFVNNPFYGMEPTGQSPRIYATGDIVRWLPDGSLAYIGRADNQVKIRGFRIEPGEVEYHLTRCEGVNSALVMAVGEAPSQQLVGYILPESKSPNTDWAHGVKQQLAEQVPAHMVPSVLMSVETWPLTPNGKIDRKALPSVDGRQISGEYVAPQNDMERELVNIWAALLKLSPDSVSTTANFFELGGDSIMSIQVVTRSRQAGYHFSVRELFNARTIRDLMPLIKRESKVVMEQEAVTGYMPLLPIQAEFFERQMVHPHHYNQSVLLKAPANFKVQYCLPVIQALYQRHDALRLRFVKHQEEQVALFSPIDESMLSHSLEFHDLSNLHCSARQHALESACNNYQRSLNFETGPLFRMVYFDFGENQVGRLLFVCHHLVIDGISWRILLRDVEQAYTQLSQNKAIKLELKTSSLQAWSHALKEYALTESLQLERSWWINLLNREVGRLPRSVDDKATGTGHCSFQLKKAHTQTLLQTCQRRFKSRINELLLSGLLTAYRQWSGESSLRVNLEWHGREALFETLEIGETLGWFTTVYPLILSSSSDDIEGILRDVKQVYRELPQNGLGFGILKYLSGDKELRELDNVSEQESILFNYLGQFDNTFDSKSEFAGASESAGDEQSPYNRPTQLLAIDGSVNQGCLNFSFTYERSAFSPDQIAVFAQLYKQCLTALAEIATTPSASGAWVLSDFPNARLESNELITLASQYPDISRLYITTPMQRGMLYHGLLDGTGELYTTISHFDLEGGLNIEAFRKSWEIVVSRHDILRTSIVAVDARVPHQLVHTSTSLPFTVLDWKGNRESTLPQALETLRASEKARGFDFSEAPLMRLTLVCLPKQRYHFIWAHHHILLDGWCQPVLFNEVVEAYQALSAGVKPIAPTQVPYENYISWLVSQDEQVALDFWRTHLAGFETALSFGRPLSDVSTTEGHGEMKVNFSQKDSDALVSLARQSQSTINVLLQFAWSYVLHRYTGESDIVFGTTISGRPANISGIEQMLGLFINTIPVRVQLDSKLSLGEIFAQIHYDNIEREHHGHLSLAEIQGVSDTAPGNALFETLLVFENYPTEVVAGQGAKLSVSDEAEGNEVYIHASDTQEYTNYPLSIGASFDGLLHIKFAWQKALFSDAFIEQLQAHFCRVLTGLVSCGLSSELSALKMLSEQESRYLLHTLNDTEANYPAEQCIHELFEQRVVQQPDAVALAYENQTLSYAQLDKRANQLARYLRDIHAAGPDVLIGLCLERGIEMIVGILGILKAGAAYVPMDPSYPDSRLDYMLSDADLKVVLSTEAVLSRLPEGDYARVVLDDHTTVDVIKQLNDSPLRNEITGVSSTNLAYVIYTSGSTGKPKGVMIEHATLVNNLCSQVDYYDYTERDNFLFYRSFCFDGAIEEYLLPLIFGACCTIYPQEAKFDLQKFIDYLKNKQITKVNISPTLLLEVKDTLLEIKSSCSLNTLILGGEKLSDELVQELISSSYKVVNSYGPTEATIDTYRYDFLDCEFTGSSIIGHVVPNCTAYVVDNNMELVPFGAIGELYLGGKCLARGYLNNDELTQNSFIANPFDDAPPFGESRLYKTGDIVRYLSDGKMEYIGRRDEQIKIRGFRIEIGEIEHQITQLDAVDSVAVLVEKTDKGDKKLVACIKLTDSASKHLIDNIIQQLAVNLPSYMMPSAYTVVDEWPRTVNGKIDKQKLLSNKTIVSHEQIIPASTDTEKQLLEICSSILHVKLEEISVTLNFFELGGHSLSTMRLVSEIRKKLDVEISIKNIFESKNFKDLANLVDEQKVLIQLKEQEKNALIKKEGML